MKKMQRTPIDRRLMKEYFLPVHTGTGPEGFCILPAGNRFFLAVFLLAMVFSPCLWTPVHAAEKAGGIPAAKAAELAGAITARLKSASDRLDDISQREDVRQLFVAGDKDALEAQAGTLAGEFEAAQKLRLLLPGQYAVDRESRPPLGYASLDLLRKAEQSTTSLSAEIHGFGGADAHIVLVRRVVDADQKLIGLLHLSLSPEPYIKLDGVESGYVELSQATDKGALVMNKVGDKGLRKDKPLKVDIEGTRWHINYWKSDSVTAAIKVPEVMTEHMEGLPLIPILLVVILLVLAAAGYRFYLRKRGGTGEDAVKTVEAGPEVVYGGAIKAIMEGKHPGLEKLIAEFPGLELFKSIKPLSKGMTGEDITRAQKTDAAPVPKPAPSPAAAAAAPAAAPVPKVPGKKTTTPPPVAAAPAPEAPARRAETTAPAATKVTPAKPATPGPAPTTAEVLPAIIFRAYDIRGIVGKTLTASGVYEIGRAVGSEADARGVTAIAVGRDGRASSPELCESLIRGLLATGRNVIDIGMVPTPMLYFATHHLETASGVMVTGSHNGPAYNGLKIMLGGETLYGEAIQALRKRVETGAMSSGQGNLETVDITADYLRRATEDIPVALGGAFKLVVDCGNGVAGMIAPQLYRALGHDVVELYCEVDGGFPNHHPDPSQPENLQALIARMQEVQADLGFAFDGDGDRLGVVDSSGNIIWPDRQLMLFARDVLSRNPGASIIYDVKCSRHMKSIIEESGGKPVMWKTGHSLIKSKMKELDAPLAGEMSGHIFFKERWFGFDDALYAGARMLEILARHKMKTAEVFAGLPGGVATPELRIMLPEKDHAAFMQNLRGKVDFKDAEISDIDGVRVDFRNGWGLIRPSNTTPCLIARFEADDRAGLEQIQATFRELIKTVAPNLKLPF